MEELEVGNKVTWVSQSQGFRKVKTGVVVKIYEPNSWIPSSEISTKYKVMFDYGYQIKKSYLVEVIEIPNHRWFVACQFHPEFKSSLRKPHPLFTAFIRAANQLRQEREKPW